ncbi:MAG: hypothetical protein H7Y27_00315 [Gemmatimonadaceae bacterium]|nr:hypothetical protein [Chitinophagaceae bacterium]
MSIQRQNTGERRQPDATPGESGRTSVSQERQEQRTDEPVTENGIRNNADKDKQTSIKKPQNNPNFAEGDDNEGNERERQDPDINTPVYDPASTEQKIPKMNS